MSKEIKLTRGKTALVDDEDYQWLSQFKWHARCCNGRWYAGNKNAFMHRKIMNALPGSEIDHVNGNGLDNRRVNLRFASRSENCSNCRPSRNNRSGYKGVHWHKGAKKWRSQIKTNGKRIHLGYFENKNDAARAYNEAAIRLHGSFARLNTIT